MALKRFKRERQRLTRSMVEERGWPHPRPSADARILFFAIGMAYVNVMQTVFAAPPDTVSGKAYDETSRAVIMVMVLLGTFLLIRAAFCRSQYSSWGWEIGSCMTFVGQAAIQFWALVSVNDRWYLASTLVWSVFWGLGNLVRGVILLRRIV